MNKTHDPCLTPIPSSSRYYSKNCGQNFCRENVTYPSESHRVKGHSHIPLRSGLLISLDINFFGGRPDRSSQSGTYPASGAIRSGGSAVLLNEVVTSRVLLVVEGEKAKAAMGRINTNENAIESLMMLFKFILSRYTIVSFRFTEDDWN